MFVKEILVFFSLTLLTYLLWKKGRFFYLASKIPWSNVAYSLENVWAALKCDKKAIFKLVYSSVQHEGIRKFWLFSTLLVIITEPDDIRKVLMSKRECILKPSWLKLKVMEQGFVFGSIETWRSRRKVLDQYFTWHKLKIFLPLFKQNSMIIVKSLEKYIGKGEFDILHHSMVLSLDTILNAMELDLNIRNQDYETQKRLIHSLEVILHTEMLKLINTWLYSKFIYKFSHTYKEEMEARKVLIFADQVMTNIRASQKSNSCDKDARPDNFIRALMSSEHERSDVEINHEIIALVVAGFDTTGITISTTLLMLAMHKNVQDKVFEELQQVFSSSESGVDYENLSNLPYLDMVINETLRLFPAIPFISRSVDEEMELGGYKIPVGSNLVIPIMKVHRDVRYWGDDANEFKPERFESEDFKKIHPYAFIPFLKGPRICLGYRFAMQLMRIHLANFLRRFEVETSMKMEELDSQVAITMTICQGYQISLKERKVEK